MKERIPTIATGRIAAVILSRSGSLLLAAGLAVATLISGCVRPPTAPPAAPGAPAVAPPPPSQATTAREYRRDGARRLYAVYPDRIYHGRMPPMLYAVGVLQVEIGSHGQVGKISWMRAPTQAPEVMAEIQQMVRRAAPFPAPQRLGRVTYTDVWLWDRSGKFQLDTLTEGQRGDEPD